MSSFRSNKNSSRLYKRSNSTNESEINQMILLNHITTKQNKHFEDKVYESVKQSDVYLKSQNIINQNSYKPHAQLVKIRGDLQFPNINTLTNRRSTLPLQESTSQNQLKPIEHSNLQTKSLLQIVLEANQKNKEKFGLKSSIELDSNRTENDVITENDQKLPSIQKQNIFVDSSLFFRPNKLLRKKKISQVIQLQQDNNTIFTHEQVISTSRELTRKSQRLYKSQSKASISQRPPSSKTNRINEAVNKIIQKHKNVDARPISESQISSLKLLMTPNSDAIEQLRRRIQKVMASDKTLLDRIQSDSRSQVSKQASEESLQKSELVPKNNQERMDKYLKVSRRITESLQQAETDLKKQKKKSETLKPQNGNQQKKQNVNFADQQDVEESSFRKGLESERQPDAESLTEQSLQSGQVQRKITRKESKKKLLEIKQRVRMMSPSMSQEQKRKYFYNKNTLVFEERALAKLHDEIDKNKPFKLTLEQIDTIKNKNRGISPLNTIEE